MAILEIENLQTHFRTPDGINRAVDGVSFHVEAGETLAVVGESGCGKTTLLRMIAGLEGASSGEISIGGQLIDAPANGTFVAPDQRGVGLVFQSYALWPHMTVARNVAFPLQVRGATPSAAIDEAVDRKSTRLNSSHRL